MAGEEFSLHVGHVAQSPHALDEQLPVRRANEEVGGVCFEGALDRVVVARAGKNQHRAVAERRWLVLADGCASRRDIGERRIHDQEVCRARNVLAESLARNFLQRPACDDIVAVPSQRACGRRPPICIAIDQNDQRAALQGIRSRGGRCR
ncbi:MAG: hypothetical protein KF755_07885 [Burkholderiaceae bacterium]|nr:hypothetical protein [Burkholderiaceae bacterium]